MRGTGTAFIGPMGSNKSSTLISKLTGAEKVGLPVFAFKSIKDTRSADGYIETRSGQRYHCKGIRNLVEVWDHFPLRDAPAVIGISECQFFNEEPKKDAEQIENLLALGNTVFIEGLNQDHFGRPMGVVPYLLSMMDYIVVLKANCMKCGGIEIATKTFKHSRGAPEQDSLSEEVGDIGGVYEPMCPSCWQQSWDTKDEYLGYPHRRPEQWAAYDKWPNEEVKDQKS